MLRGERRDQKKDKALAKHQRRNNRKAMWLLDYLRARKDRIID